MHLHINQKGKWLSDKISSKSCMSTFFQRFILQCSFSVWLSNCTFLFNAWSLGHNVVLLIKQIHMTINFLLKFLKVSSKFTFTLMVLLLCIRQKYCHPSVMLSNEALCHGCRVLGIIPLFCHSSKSHSLKWASNFLLEM